MLEELAHQYVNQSEDSMRFLGYGLSVTGAVMAGLTSKSSGELARAPYFAYSVLLFFILAVTQLMWLGSIPAMKGGYLWVFMLVDVLTGLAIGYGVGLIAMARSKDAYGHGRLAVLAFIPLANFWLLLTRSRADVSPNRAPTIPLLSGGLGVFTGFVLLAASIGLTTFIRLESERLAQAAQTDPAMQEMSIDFLIQSNGLDATLREMASGVSTPSPVDEATTITRVEGDGTTLRYTYEVTTATDALPMSMRIGLVQQNCAYPALRPALEAGATVEHVYLRPDGSEIGVVQVTKKICGL